MQCGWLTGSVIALFSLVAASAPSRAAQPALESLTDPVDASRWLTTGCGARLIEQPGWAEVAKNFVEVNSHGPRRLETMLPLGSLYYFISRHEIEADDAVLSLIYPGGWQRLPESIEYAAVSLVGFNESKTKAVVFDRTRSTEGFDDVALVNGQWVVPKLGFGCSRGVA